MQEDIREPEQSQEKEKAPKAPKAPKPPKPPKPSKPPLPKPKKQPAAPKKKTSGAAVFCVFLIVLALAGAALTYFNVGGAGEAVVAVLQSNLPVDEQAIEGPTAQELEKKQDELTKLAEKLEKNRQTLDMKDDELSARDKALEEREKTLSDEQAAFEQKSADVYALEQAQTEIKATAQILERMNVPEAAEAVSRLTPVSRIAGLLKAMDGEKAAQILNNIAAAQRTRIIEAMIGEDR